MRNGLKLRVVACAVAGVMLLCGTAFGQGLLPFAGMGQSGATSNNYFEFFQGIGVTGARAGFFYGWGDIRVEDVVALGQNNILLWQDFASFVHHRKADLRDAYFSAAIGIGTPETECLTVRMDTNIGATTQFKQYTDAANLSIPYRSAFAILALGNNEAGFISLNNRNRFWALDVCARIPYFAAFDFLAGYKWLWIKNNIDPYSSDTPANQFPVFPGQAGWTPAWADALLVSTTKFEMVQKFSWHGPFIGIRMSNTPGYGFQWFFDTRVYPWLFGSYQFAWNGAYLDPFANFEPGIWGAQYSDIGGTERWGVDVDFRIRSSLRRLLTLELEGRYQYASMSGSTLEFQQTGNVYGPFAPAYWGAGNYSQNTPETLNIRQQVWMIGGNLEIGF
jgi:hypothetical protein